MHFCKKNKDINLWMPNPHGYCYDFVLTLMIRGHVNFGGETNQTFGVRRADPEPQVACSLNLS